MASGDTNQSLVAKFHKAFGVNSRMKFDLEDGELIELRRSLIAEEAAEVDEALYEAHAKDVRPELAKELADLLVVAYGTAEVFGIDLDWAFRETMASNMTKLDSDGKPIYREDGKVLKGPNYRPPNMRMVVYGNPEEYTQAN